MKAKTGNILLDIAVATGTAVIAGIFGYITNKPKNKRLYDVCPKCKTAYPAQQGYTKFCMLCGTPTKPKEM